MIPWKSDLYPIYLKLPARVIFFNIPFDSKYPISRSKCQKSRSHRFAEPGSIHRFMVLFLITSEFPDKRNGYTTLVVQFPKAAILTGLVDFHCMRHIATEIRFSVPRYSDKAIGRSNRAHSHKKRGSYIFASGYKSTVRYKKGKASGKDCPRQRNKNWSDLPAVSHPYKTDRFCRCLYPVEWCASDWSYSREPHSGIKSSHSKVWTSHR